MGLNNGDSDGFSWFNFKVQIISQGNAEIRLSLAHDIGIFFNNDCSVSGRPPAGWLRKASMILIKNIVFVRARIDLQNVG